MKKHFLLLGASASLFAFKAYEEANNAIHFGPHYLHKNGTDHVGYVINYERTVPHGFYFGTDLVTAFRDSDSHGKFETRFGYMTNNLNGVYLTPFVTMGHFQNRKDSEREDFAYQGVGTHVNMSSCQFFNLGLSGQMMAFQSFKNKFDEVYYGWEVSAPIKIFPESWDVEFKPYFTKFNSDTQQNHFGVKASVGYIF
jgi:hypothetical protein